MPYIRMQLVTFVLQNSYHCQYSCFELMFKNLKSEEDLQCLSITYTIGNATLCYGHFFVTEVLWIFVSNPTNS